MIGDAGQNVAETGFGVEAVEFGGADQAVDRGGSLATGIRRDLIVPGARRPK